MVIGAVWMMVFNVSLGTSPTSLLHPSALLVAYPPPSWSARRGGRSLPGLAFYRAAAQMTQPELARHSGVARDTVLRIERLQRRTSPCTINSLAAALATAPERLHGVSSRATNPDRIATSSILRSQRIFLECTGPAS
jgi:DNA-binding XRE family transcriptional regulator